VNYRTAIVLGSWLLLNPPIRGGQRGTHAQPDALVDDWTVAGDRYDSEGACERARNAWIARWSAIRRSLPAERSFDAFAEQADESRCLPDAVVQTELLVGRDGK
jgi:hypothetical protein